MNTYITVKYEIFECFCWYISQVFVFLSFKVCAEFQTQITQNQNCQPHKSNMNFSETHVKQYYCFIWKWTQMWFLYQTLVLQLSFSANKFNIDFWIWNVREVIQKRLYLCSCFRAVLFGVNVAWMFDRRVIYTVPRTRVSFVYVLWMFSVSIMYILCVHEEMEERLSA